MDSNSQVDHSYRPENVCCKRFLTVPSHKVWAIFDACLKLTFSHSKPYCSFTDYVDAYA